MNNTFDILIDSFLEKRVGIDPVFLTETLSKGLLENIIQLQKDHRMTVSGIGNGQIRDLKQMIRTDKICWINKSTQNPFEQQFLDIIENFIEYLNRTCYTGINDYEFHYAVYEAGSFYKRHKDQFKNDSNRKYSLINYLNENWLEGNGGELRIYQNESVQNILPQSKTAVFFKSDEMEHEVRTANRSRMSITGWLKQV
jgi:SM-20-related protein